MYFDIKKVGNYSEKGKNITSRVIIIQYSADLLFSSDSAESLSKNSPAISRSLALPGAPYDVSVKVCICSGMSELAVCNRKTDPTCTCTPSTAVFGGTSIRAC